MLSVKCPPVGVNSSPVLTILIYVYTDSMETTPVCFRSFRFFGDTDVDVNALSRT